MVYSKQTWTNGVTEANADTLGHIEDGIEAATTTADAASAAVASKAPIANPTFTGTVSGVTKAHVGLGNVDNTADSAKPVSTAQQTALNLKAPLASPAFTGTPTGITKSHVGLANVDNTSDANKPVSTAQAAAIATKTTLVVDPSSTSGLADGTLIAYTS